MTDDDWNERSLEALNTGDISTLQKQLQALPPELLAKAVEAAHDMGNRAVSTSAAGAAIKLLLPASSRCLPSDLSSQSLSWWR